MGILGVELWHTVGQELLCGKGWVSSIAWQVLVGTMGLELPCASLKGLCMVVVLKLKRGWKL